MPPILRQEGPSGRRHVRIVHIVTSLAVSAGGVARAVLDAAAGLCAAGAQVDILSFEDGVMETPWGSRQPSALQLSLVPPESSGRQSGGRLVARLRELLADSPDVIHLHGLWQPVMLRAAALARQQNIPYVCSVHGMLDPWSVRQSAIKKRVYFSLFERRRLARAAALHFTAEQESLKAAPWCPLGPRRLIIPLMLNLAPYRELPSRELAGAEFPDIPGNSPWVLFLSRIHPKKGLDLLIDAVAALPQKDVQLVIAGDGDPAYVQSMRGRAAAAGITERTHFVGLVQGTRKIALFRRADVMALPTSQENFGIVFPEALACETPVLLTEGVDICREIVATGGGLLIRRDAADIARQIETLLSTPAAARARGQKGRQWVMSTLEPQAIAAQWMEAYTDIVRSNRK